MAKSYCVDSSTTSSSGAKQTTRTIRVFPNLDPVHCADYSIDVDDYKVVQELVPEYPNGHLLNLLVPYVGVDGTQQKKKLQKSSSRSLRGGGTSGFTKNQQQEQLQQPKKSDESNENEGLEFRVASLRLVDAISSSVRSLWGSGSGGFTKSQENEQHLHQPIYSDENEDSEFRVVSLRLGDVFDLAVPSCPPSIGTLDQLRILDLSRSTMSMLPKEIGNLSNLRELHLRSTKNLSHLPESIGNLTKLEMLKLQSSGLVALPPSIGKLINLKILRLGYTKRLTQLPEEIGNLEKLERLLLPDSGILALPPSIGRLHNLKDLSLSCTRGLTELPDEIGNLKNLELLDVGMGIDQLPPSLMQLKRLLRIYLRYTNVPDSEQERYQYLTACNRVRNLTGLGTIIVLEEDTKHKTRHKTSNSKEPLTSDSNKVDALQRKRQPTTTLSPKLWPLVLKHSVRAFTRYPSDKDNDTRVDRIARQYTISQASAIYQLLSDGRESFLVTVVANRNNNKMTFVDVPSSGSSQGILTKTQRSVSKRLMGWIHK